jgi:hypothetical protein
MTLNLIADQIVKGRIYPAFAQHQALPYTQEWRKFDQQWPYTIPLRLQEYCDYHDVKFNILTLHDVWPKNALYPIGLGFFDFTIDYFSLLPDRVFTELLQSNIKLLFYYHEGDNPYQIKLRLDTLCDQHKLSPECYVFVSGNTASRNIPGFIYFTDFELWYYQRNRASPALKIHSRPREFDFTVLNRLHKSWRATAMADLQHNGILDNSYWSYCEIGELDNNNPIEIDTISGLRTRTEQFLKSAPYVSDELDFDQRNDHSTLVPKYYINSYCNIVMETHFHIENSGTFLTEKTFKPIKHGQLFFVAGPAGSLQVLRDLGYCVFDSVLDNSYDLETDATQRWRSLIRSIYFARMDLPLRFKVCQSEIEHNQKLFQTVKTQRLNNLIKEINEYH